MFLEKISPSIKLQAQQWHNSLPLMTVKHLFDAHKSKWALQHCLVADISLMGGVPIHGSPEDELHNLCQVFKDDAQSFNDGPQYALYVRINIFKTAQ